MNTHAFRFSVMGVVVDVRPGCVMLINDGERALFHLVRSVPPKIGESVRLDCHIAYRMYRGRWQNFLEIDNITVTNNQPMN